MEYEYLQKLPLTAKQREDFIAKGYATPFDMYKALFGEAGYFAEVDANPYESLRPHLWALLTAEQQKFMSDFVRDARFSGLYGCINFSLIIFFGGTIGGILLAQFLLLFIRHH
jgi:hypothetical protein